MKKIVALAAAFAFMPAIAMAEPAKMTDAQLDDVAAGQLIEVSNNNIVVDVAAAVNACVIVENCRPNADARSPVLATTGTPVNGR